MYGTGGDAGGSVLCIGDLNNFSSVLSPAFRAATVFVGLSVIVIVLCVLAFLLFLPMRSDSVFEICGTMQFLSGRREKELTSASGGISLLNHHPTFFVLYIMGLPVCLIFGGDLL